MQEVLTIWWGWSLVAFILGGVFGVLITGLCLAMAEERENSNANPDYEPYDYH